MTINVTSATEPAPSPQAEGGSPSTESKSAQGAQQSAHEQKNASESETEGSETEGSLADGSDADADSDGDEVDAKDANEDGRHKRKTGYQRRIDKLNAAKADAQREAEYWKQQAMSKSQKPEVSSQAPQSDKPSQQASSADGKPDANDFQSYTEYAEALADWKVEQKLAARDQEAEKARLMTEHEKTLNSHADRVKSFREKTADFQEMMENLDDVPKSAALEHIIVSSENGPELLYELAKDPKEAKRIAALPPLALAREIGRIESRLAKEAGNAPAKVSPEKEPKRTTKAPAPISPVGAKGGATEKSIFDPNLSQREYEAIRAKQRSASA